MVRQVWITSDNLQFSDKDAAELHEVTIVKRELIDYLFYGVDRVESRVTASAVADKLLEKYTITKKTDAN